MALSFLTDQSAGAPALSGTNGTLCAVLDWALPQQGWAIEYTDGANARVYRPGSGNRFRLHVNHNSTVSGQAYLATVRGCENATSATALVDPFPTVTQVTNGSASVCTSNMNNATARPYRIVVTPTLVVLSVGTTGLTTGGWDLFLFGDTVPTYAGDAYATVILVGGTTASSVSSRGMANSMASGVLPTKLFWCRSVDGATKSTQGCLVGAGTSMGSVTGTPQMRDGYLNQIVRDRLAASCCGSATTTSGPMAIYRRGWVPNVWNPICNGSGGLGINDTFTDTAYAAGSQFIVAPAASNISAILETTDTWTAPSG